MKRLLKAWPFLLSLATLGTLLALTAFLVTRTEARPSPWQAVRPPRAHLDHGPFYTKAITSPQALTKSCLECHPQAANEVRETAHWQWRDKTHGLGKLNLLNNFCLGIAGNWNGCTKCHVGYGWKDQNFDFKDSSKVDCVVCHDWSGRYVKGPAGMPEPGVDLQAVAKSVGYPKRENCSVCHSYGGGGLGVKHGDLDSSLVNPNENLDVHMGRHKFLCVDCHKTKHHQIQGKAFSVSIDHEGGFDCTQCHQQHKHQDKRLDSHLDAVACQTCHIPTFARKHATKTEWDWSKAGDGTRKDDAHHYLKIKGEFVYDANIVPSYAWFNHRVKRYLLGDKLAPETLTELNKPQGSIADPTAKIWPFKLHDAKQIYDTKHNYLLQPVTSGEGGYWREFDWNKALRLAEPLTGLAFSGSYGFAKTRMHWPLNHMVVPKEKSLSCADCHGPQQTRMNWKELGYESDPVDSGGRNHRRAPAKTQHWTEKGARQ